MTYAVRTASGEVHRETLTLTLTLTLALTLTLTPTPTLTLTLTLTPTLTPAPAPAPTPTPTPTLTLTLTLTLDLTHALTRRCTAAPRRSERTTRPCQHRSRPACCGASRTRRC